MLWTILLKIRLIGLKGLSSLILALCFLLLTASTVVRAEDVNVTATVPDHIPPSTPILISPPDGAVIADNTPTLSWYESTDNMGVAYYRLYLNGRLYLDNLPLTAHETSAYILEYDALNGIYYLTLKDALPDRSYSWQIRVYDFAGNVSESVIWTFTVDTLAPTFIVKKIGDVYTNISAQNPASVPEDPVLLFRNDPDGNEPTIIAIGEAYSEVRLRVTIPNDPEQIHYATINSHGNYEFKLGILPRDVDIRLDFTITDRAGHVSVLEELYIRIDTHYWPGTPTPTPTSSSIFPTYILTPTPTPTEAVPPWPTPYATPTPTIILGKITPVPIASPTPTPTPKKPGDVIQIPLVPPKEVVHELVQESKEIMPVYFAKLVDQVLKSKFWISINSFSALLFLLILPILTFILILTKYLNIFSIKLLSEIIKLIFFLPFRMTEKRNLVFEYASSRAAALVKVELSKLDSGEVLDYKLTDHNGNFADFDWPLNQNLKLRINDRNYYYPVGVLKPVQLTYSQFYQDEVFQFTDKNQAPFLIPTLMAHGQDNLPIKERIRHFLIYLSSYPWWVFFMVFLPVLILSMRYYSIANWIALILIVSLGLAKLWQLIKLSSLSLFKLAVYGKNGQKYHGRIIVSLQSSTDKFSLARALPVSYSTAKTLSLAKDNYYFTVFAKERVNIFNGQALASQHLQIKDQENKFELSMDYIESNQNTFAKLKPLCQL